MNAGRSPVRAPCPPRSHSFAFVYLAEFHVLRGLEDWLATMLLRLVLFLCCILVAQVAGRILGLRASRAKKRENILAALGVENAGAKKIVGFFHPYW